MSEGRAQKTRAAESAKYPRAKSAVGIHSRAGMGGVLKAAVTAEPTIVSRLLVGIAASPARNSYI